MNSSTSGSPEITLQPVSQTVPAGQPATFTVSAASNSPLTYQWRKNGSNIAGATSSSYTTPPTTTADSGSTFQVIVSNSSRSTAKCHGYPHSRWSPQHHDAAGEPDGERGTDGDIHSGGDGRAAAELSVAEEPGEYRRGDVSKLHDAGDDERGQWDELPGDRNEPGYERDEQRGDADGQRRSQHHDATGKPDGERGTDGDVHGGGDGRAAVELSVAEEPGEYRRGHVSELHDAGDDECGQWDELPGDRNESGYERDEQRGDADGQRRSQHHDATGQPDGERGTDGDIHSSGDGRAAVELSVAEEPGEYRRGHVSELHDAGDDERGQWDELPGDRNESGYECDEQRGDADGQRRSQHHDATGQPDGERGTDGDVHSSGDRRARL